MTDTTPDTAAVDWRTQIAEWVAGQHRPTRHADLCLDPSLALRLADAQAAVTIAQGDVDSHTDDDPDTGTRRLGQPTPLQQARQALDAARADLDRLSAQARDRTIRLVFTGLTSADFAALITQAQAKPVDDRQQWENITLTCRCLTDVITVDGDPTGIDHDTACRLIETLPIGLLTPLYAAAVEACTAGQNLPF